MRVIAGKYRSRKLQTLRGLSLRPSSDRLRETLFNIVGTAVDDAVFVDLFAGSGAVGIEALSRGARHAFFVENHAAGTALLHRNLTELNIAIASERASSSAVRTQFSGIAEIISMDAVVALERLAMRRIRADIVFADPPYSKAAAYSAVLDLLGDGGLLSDSGLVILEHDRRRQLPAFAGQLERTRIVEQGDSALSLYRVVLAA